MTKDDFVLAVLALSNGATHTPVQVQKLFFLLDMKISNRLGGPFFNFHPDDYGPFDADVYRTLESLSRKGLISIDAVPDLRRKVYRTTPSGQAVGRQIPLPAELSTYMQQLSAWMRGLSFAELVSAIYAEFPGMKAKSVFRAH